MGPLISFGLGHLVYLLSASVWQIYKTKISFLENGEEALSPRILEAARQSLATHQDTHLAASQPIRLPKLGNFCHLEMTSDTLLIVAQRSLVRLKYIASHFV